MPYTYRHATAEFRHFLKNAREALDLSSDNMTYTAVDGVFRAFRRRLVAQQAVEFANQLPAVLRAMFVQDWQIAEVPAAFGVRSDWTHEAQSLRKHHNLMPDHVVEAVAWAVRQEVREVDFDRVLRGISKEAVEFWSVSAEFAARMDELTKG